MTRAALAAMALAVAVAAAALTGCGAEHEPPANDDASAWLSDVMSAHARADEALAIGRSDIAAEVLRGAFDRPVAREVAPEHARIVRQDLSFRLASAELASAPERALHDAERGLALGRQDDLFSSNLLAVRGRALQALGRDTEAASSSQEALAIAERLLEAVLRRGGTGGP